jgi:phage minor structural protein
LKLIDPEVWSDFVPYIDYSGEKRREVSIKESNYFNILQSLAEKFECWLTFDFDRDDNGKVNKKYVIFKNYVSNENVLGFRYGLNLNSIQRTNESKSLVTKLIVKPNQNEFAKNKFCTIARAVSNPTGETAIYDFSYYFNQDLMS